MLNSRLFYFHLVFLISVFSFCFAFQKEDPRIRAVYDLIERMTPEYSNQFIIELIEPVDEKDVYEISGSEGKIILRGNNPVALATAYNQYLKYTCKVHFSWLGDQIKLPSRLPAPCSDVENTINGKYRVYMNYCTLSNLATWWDWKRWGSTYNKIRVPITQGDEIETANGFSRNILKCPKSIILRKWLPIGL